MISFFDALLEKLTWDGVEELDQTRQEYFEGIINIANNFND